MPIGDDEFNKGQKYVGLAKEILDFLCENKRKAYTIDELTENLRPSFRSISSACAASFCNPRIVLFRSLTVFLRIRSKLNNTIQSDNVKLLSIVF
jgi:hypothetical protein